MLCPISPKHDFRKWGEKTENLNPGAVRWQFYPMHQHVKQHNIVCFSYYSLCLLTTTLNIAHHSSSSCLSLQSKGQKTDGRLHCGANNLRTPLSTSICIRSVKIKSHLNYFK